MLLVLPTVFAWTKPVVTYEAGKQLVSERVSSHLPGATVKGEGDGVYRKMRGKVFLWKNYLFRITAENGTKTYLEVDTLTGELREFLYEVQKDITF